MSAISKVGSEEQRLIQQYEPLPPISWPKQCCIKSAAFGLGGCLSGTINGWTDKGLRDKEHSVWLSGFYGLILGLIFGWAGLGCAKLCKKFCCGPPKQEEGCCAKAKTIAARVLCCCKGGVCRAGLSPNVQYCVGRQCQSSYLRRYMRTLASYVPVIIASAFADDAAEANLNKKYSWSTHDFFLDLAVGTVATMIAAGVEMLAFDLFEGGRYCCVRDQQLTTKQKKELILDRITDAPEGERPRVITMISDEHNISRSQVQEIWDKDQQEHHDHHIVSGASAARALGHKNLSDYQRIN